MDHREWNVLLLVTGLPGSGKTSVCQKILQYHRLATTLAHSNSTPIPFPSKNRRGLQNSAEGAKRSACATHYESREGEDDHFLWLSSIDYLSFDALCPPLTYCQPGFNKNKCGKLKLKEYQSQQTFFFHTVCSYLSLSREEAGGARGRVQKNPDIPSSEASSSHRCRSCGITHRCRLLLVEDVLYFSSMRRKYFSLHETYQISNPSHISVDKSSENFDLGSRLGGASKLDQKKSTDTLFFFFLLEVCGTMGDSHDPAFQKICWERNKRRRPEQQIPWFVHKRCINLWRKPRHRWEREIWMRANLRPLNALEGTNIAGDVTLQSVPPLFTRNGLRCSILHFLREALFTQPTEPWAAESLSLRFTFSSLTSSQSSHTSWSSQTWSTKKKKPSKFTHNDEKKLRELVHRAITGTNSCSAEHIKVGGSFKSLPREQKAMYAQKAKRKVREQMVRLTSGALPCVQNGLIPSPRDRIQIQPSVYQDLNRKRTREEFISKLFSDALYTLS